MTTTFYPYPFPVETPLGQGYALYVTTAPMWENDQHACVLDDRRLLHFASNQLRYVGNGSYDMKKPRPMQGAEEEAPALEQQLRDLKEASHARAQETGAPAEVVTPPGAVALVHKSVRIAGIGGASWDSRCGTPEGVNERFTQLDSYVTCHVCKAP